MFILFRNTKEAKNIVAITKEKQHVLDIIKIAHNGGCMLLVEVDRPDGKEICTRYNYDDCGMISGQQMSFRMDIGAFKNLIESISRLEKQANSL